MKIPSLSNFYWLWVAFGFWFSILFFLSYFSFSWVLGSIVLLLGLMVSVFLLSKASSSAVLESLGDVPWFAWLVLAILAFGLRFYRLTTLSTWPITDEGYHGFLALDLFRTGKFHFFYTVARFPPFYIWALAGFFKLVTPSLFSLWLFPALLSCLTVVVAYMAARRIKNHSFALFFTAFTALSFWPVYAARYSHPAVLMLLWEYVALWRLVCFIQSDERHRTENLFGSV